MSRWLPFAAALLVRCGVAFIFFGSWDLITAIRDTEKLLAGVKPSLLGVPYLPGAHALVIWSAGVIAFHTVIPIAFLYKLAACLFDAVIAAAIGESRGLKVGLLYAFMPVQILVFSIHGQWDSISLALFMSGILLMRRPGSWPAAGAGALAVASVIAKPITVPFLIFLVERRRIGPLAAGAAAAGVIYLAVLWWAGDPLSGAVIRQILDYAGKGVTHLGLPVALGFMPSRLVWLVPLILLAILYWRGRLDREDAVAIGYAFVLGLSGLAGQYLAWAAPFLLLRGHVRFAGLYGLVAGLYLTLANTSVGYDGTNYAARVAFAPLRSMAWLTPALTFVDAKVFLLSMLGDVVLPLSCLAFAVWSTWRRAGVEEKADSGVPKTTSLAPLAVAGALIVTMLGAAWLLQSPTAEAFRSRSATKMAGYAMTDPPADRKVDAATIAYAWIGVWSVVAFTTRRSAGRTGSRSG